MIGVVGQCLTVSPEQGWGGVLDSMVRGRGGLLVYEIYLGTVEDSTSHLRAPGNLATKPRKGAGPAPRRTAIVLRVAKKKRSARNGGLSQNSTPFAKQICYCEVDKISSLT